MYIVQRRGSERLSRVFHYFLLWCIDFRHSENRAQRQQIVAHPATHTPPLRGMMSKVFWAIRISRCISLSVSLSLSLSLHTDMNTRILMGYWSQGEKMHQKGLLSLSPSLTYPTVYTRNLHQGNVNDNQWGYCNPPSRLFPLPSTFLPTSPSGRYLPNPTYLSALTCLVIVPTNPLTIKRTMLEEIKWGYLLKENLFLKGMIKIFANTFHGDIACNHLRWGYCI